MIGLREVAVGVLVATAELYVTNTTVLTCRGGGCLVIDPAVTVAEISALAADLAAAGLRPEAGFATHPHWDHLLWTRSLGNVPRYATARAAAAAAARRDSMLGELQRDAPGHDLSLFARCTPLPPAAAAIPWHGPEATLVTHDGHAPGHSAVFVAATGTLIAGDMCSDIEIPLLDTDQGDPVGDYRAGLRRLAALPGVRQVVPGHGTVGDAAEFRRRVAADLAYLDDLERGADSNDGRLAVAWLRREHQAQRRFLHPAAPC
ncbi:MAG TPA: MBL fold metallo-hydrolase [Streptosporangiaceae bacterium]|nr:MBL fold metallo-hydrolase [Streptosporangiaceae bacterium]